VLVRLRGRWMMIIEFAGISDTVDMNFLHKLRMYFQNGNNFCALRENGCWKKEKAKENRPKRKRIIWSWMQRV